ncbi:MAG: septum formation initiator family protein [Bacteroidales bacterium]|nr:septum formation initiator family protein [Bacteroidales bacterium]
MEEGKKKDRWAWLKRKDHNYLLPFIIIVTVPVALWLLFFAPHNSGLIWIKASMEEKNQQVEITRLQAEIKELEREVETLRNNLDSLEAFARETYHFAAPGDDVFIVE